MATLIPWSAANLACSFQNGATTSSHCHFKISRKSGGHGQVTQLGYLAFGPSPGHSEKSTTTGTPNFSANKIVFRLISRFCLAIFLSGWIGLPWQLRALMLISYLSSLALNSASSEALSSMDNLQCALPG